jgi:hypothetical protein
VCGAIYFANQVAKTQRWKPGVWHNDGLLQYHSYLEHYGNNLLNSQVEFTTLDAFRQAEHPVDQEFFFRPISDHKQFGGQKIVYGNLKDWFDKINAVNAPSGYALTWDTPIIVSSPMTIDLEWRVFIVNGRCVAGSQYRHYHHFERVPGLPPAVRSFANAMAAQWSPLPVYVMDICLSNGQLKVLELGAFNSAGFYHADKLAIVASINEMLV